MDGVNLSAAGNVEDLVDVEVSLGRSDAVESEGLIGEFDEQPLSCLLYTSPSPRDATLSRMPSSA